MVSQYTGQASKKNSTTSKLGTFGERGDEGGGLSVDALDVAYKIKHIMLALVACCKCSLNNTVNRINENIQIETLCDKTTWRFLEDNDPTGFKSNEGKAAKREAKIRTFGIPRSSPDLNVLDNAICKQVIRKMRAQEKKFPKSKRETRAEYIARLRKVAKRLPADFISKAVGNMATRCRCLCDAQGGHFEEGGC